MHTIIHRRCRKFLPALLLALAAAGCDGSNEDHDESGGEAPARGQLLQDPPDLVDTYSAAQLLALGNAADFDLLLHAEAPVCDVAVYRIEYTTVGGAAENTTATGALMVPGGVATQCIGARPIVLYAHGTSTDSAFDITHLGDEENAEGLYLAAFFAAHGYIVVAPNYAGYNTSPLSYHPYLNGDQQSKDMIDALTAARSALPAPAASGTTDDGRLYVTGYSQGGYVAMATHRAMEAAGLSVTASAPMSGPYALSAFVDAVFFGRVNDSAPVLGTFLITSYQNSYGNVYASAAEVFEPAYAPDIESLLPSTKPRSQLYADGDLPRHALFDSVPPEPAYAAITPATTPAVLAPTFARGFGVEHLILNSYRLAYLNDAQANPDGVWPNTTTSEPPANPALPLRQALQRNDLRNWTPTAPTLLCGGNADPTVFWLNTQAMQAYWSSHAPAAPYTVLDVDAAGGGDADPYDDLKSRFGLAKDIVALAAIAQGATDDGAAAVADIYHGGLVAPFCLEAVKDFFEDN